MLCLNLMNIQLSTNNLLMAFQRYVPKHHCRVSDEWTLNASLPTVVTSSGDLEYEQCSMYVDPTNHSKGTQGCVDGYKFYVEGSEWTVATEWNLVCGRRYLVATITTVYFAGVMIGGPLFGSLADRFGRKPLMLLGLYSQAVLGVSLYFVYDLVAYTAIRFSQGILAQGMQNCAMALAMELLSPWFRMVAPLGFGLCWVSGVLLLTCITYFVEHWRYIQLFLAIPTLLTLFYIWLIPESLRWLVSNGYSRRARAVASRIARYSGLKLSEDVLEDLDRMCSSRAGENKAKNHILDLFRNATLRRYSLILFFVWFNCSTTYYSISFKVSSLSGNRFLNFVYSGALDLGVLPFAFICLHFFGRRTCLVSCLLLSGITVTGATVVQILSESDIINVSSLVTGLALFGRSIGTRCFGFAVLSTSEVFPTVMRSLGMGACLFWTRVGGMVAPQLVLLGEETYSWLPFLLVGLLAIMGGGLSLLLPETKGRALPDTIGQAGQTDRKQVPRSVDKTTSARWVVQEGTVVRFTCETEDREETKL